MSSSSGDISITARLEAAKWLVFHCFSQKPSPEARLSTSASVFSRTRSPTAECAFPLPAAW